MNWFAVGFFGAIGACLAIFLLRLLWLTILAFAAGVSEGISDARWRRLRKRAARIKQVDDVEARWRAIDSATARLISTARYNAYEARRPKRRLLPPGFSYERNMLYGTRYIVRESDGRKFPVDENGETEPGVSLLDGIAATRKT